MTKFKMFLFLSCLISISSETFAFDPRLLGIALSNAANGYNAVLESQRQSDEQTAREIALRNARIDLAIKEEQFRRMQPASSSFYQREQSPNISCEADCKNMHESGELKVGITIDSCIATLCGK